MEKYPYRFLAYTNIIIDKLEGGYVNHPNDPGGATNYGITERVARAHGYSGDMRDLPRDFAISIYYKDYWDGKIMDHLKNNIAFHVYDCSINSGYSRAIKNLQEAVGVTPDGVIGVGTMNAISSFSETDLISRYCIQRLYFYASLSTFKTFGKGWRNRLFTISNIDWESVSEQFKV